MPSHNSVHLIGNITRDPEVHYTPKGAAVCDFSIAINRTYKTEAGEKREEVTYVDCVAWMKLAELIGQWVKKGDPIFLEGRLENKQWGDKATGQRRSKMRVSVNQVQFLARRGAESGEQSRRSLAPISGDQRPDDSDGLDEDDGIPF